MSKDDKFNRLCQKTSDVLEILKDKECKLTDDTYLDHMASGIKYELCLQEPHKGIEFWNKSNCSTFVQSFKGQAAGCQNFILKVLNEVCMLDVQIKNEALQVILDLIKGIVISQEAPTEAFLDLLTLLCTVPNAKNLDSEKVDNLKLFCSEEYNVWETMLKPLILMPSNNLPTSHFWKTAFSKLVKNFITSHLITNIEYEKSLANEFFPVLIVTPLGYKIFGEILDFFLESSWQVEDRSFDDTWLRTILNNEYFANAMNYQIQVKVLTILKEYEQAQSVLETQFFLLDPLKGNQSTQLWFKCAKQLIETLERKSILPNESFINCMFKCLSLEKSSNDSSNVMRILVIQGLSTIQLGSNLERKFVDQVFQILESIYAKYLSTRNFADLTISINIRLLSSSIVAVSSTNRKEIRFEFNLKRLNILSGLSTHPDLAVHLQCQILECIRNSIKHLDCNSNDFCPTFGIYDIMLQLWGHSLSGSDWRLKDLLISILCEAFRIPGLPLTWKGQISEPTIEFPSICFSAFVHRSLEHSSSFVRASSIELISCVLRYLNRPIKSECMVNLLENMSNYHDQQLKATTIRLFSTDTEAVVRRAIIRENLIVLLNDQCDLKAAYTGKFKLIAYKIK